MNVHTLTFGAIQIILIYGKLVETFHNVSECKTAVYFGGWFTLQFRWLGDGDL